MTLVGSKVCPSCYDAFCKLPDHTMRSMLDKFIDRQFASRSEERRVKAQIKVK